MPKKPAFGMPPKVRPPRGGVVVPTKYKRATRPSPNSQNVDMLIDSIKKAAINKGAELSFDAIAKVVDKLGSKTITLKNGSEAGRINAPGDDKREFTKLSTIGNPKVLVLGTDSVKIHRATVDTGIPTSKTLKRMKSQNGVTTLTVFDTKNQGTTSNIKQLRKMLTFGTGFEQRGYKAFGRDFYMTPEDIYTRIGSYSANLVSSAYAEQRVYASILGSTIEYNIRNQSAFLKAKVKVHLCAYANPPILGFEDPIEAIKQRVFWVDADNSAPTENDRQDYVPQYLQYGLEKLEVLDENVEKQTKSISANMSNKGAGIATSPYFRENFMIVDTKTFTLGAGDILNYKHNHHYGSGVDLTAYASNNSDSENGTSMRRLLHYFAIIEYVGLPCEAVYWDPSESAPDASQQYIGTSPVILSAEFKKSITYLNSPDDGVTSNTLSIGQRQTMHTRIFTKGSLPRAEQQTKDFNLGVDKWSSTPGIGLFTVPVMTDRVLQTIVSDKLEEIGTDIVDGGSTL